MFCMLQLQYPWSIIIISSFILNCQHKINMSWWPVFVSISCLVFAAGPFHRAYHIGDASFSQMPFTSIRSLPPNASFSSFLKFLLLTYFQWSLFLPCEITSSNLVAKPEDLSDLPFSPFSLAQDIKISRANIWGKHLKISTYRLAQAWTKIQIWAAAAPWYRISLLLHLMTLLQALWMTKTCLPN